VSCARTRGLLDAWLDGELDAATGAQIDAHVGGCAACAALRDERERLREAVRRGVPREAVPRHVAEGVRQGLESAGKEQAIRRRGPTWRQASAMAFGAACVAATATFLAVYVLPAAAIPEQAVARHVAALAHAEGRPERLVQVVSSDRHTVKPWFLGKIELSPPVRDLSVEGFTLVGGRLDRVGDRAAAVVVYRIREHPIELYVTLDSANAAALRLHATRGFNVAQWSSEGLAYAAVSDVDARDLERFARTLQQR
jgi:anti-sigma factor RsiW